MKIQSILMALSLAVIAVAAISSRVTAQTVQYVTLAVSATGVGGTGSISYYALATNQVVQLVSFVANSPPSGYQLPDVLWYHSSGVVVSSLTNNGDIFTGLTNISFNIGGSSGGGLATFKVTTPACATVVSNYVPADAIVIPASATGNVQVILESSPDLVNWTAAEPGTYSAASATNRFFRVRAVVN